MKKTDLEKNKGLKLRGQMQKAAIPGRFAQGSTALPDRREQRKLDQAAGLVPFAVKLHADLVTQLRELAEREGIDLNALSDRLIRAGLLGAPSASTSVTEGKTKAAVAKSAVAKEAPAKKAPAKKAVKSKT